MLCHGPLCCCCGRNAWGRAFFLFRLQQKDCVFVKEPGFDATNWHSDLRMAPFDTNDYVTAWLPLRPVAGGDGDSGLQFASGSHRDFALPFWHDLRKVDDLAARGYPVVSEGAMEVGDVTWHHGWTLHYAPPQPQHTPARLAVSVSYFADGARLLARKARSVYKHQLHNEDYESFADWLPELKDGAVAAHPRLPLVYP